MSEVYLYYKNKTHSTLHLQDQRYHRLGGIIRTELKDHYYLRIGNKYFRIGPFLTPNMVY